MMFQNGLSQQTLCNITGQKDQFISKELGYFAIDAEWGLVYKEWYTNFKEEIY